MKILCKVCGEFFSVDEDTIALMSDRYLLSTDVNICDECWEMLNQPPESLIDEYSDADPGL